MSNENEMTILRDSEGKQVPLGQMISDSGMTAVIYRSEFEGNDVVIKVLRPNSTRIIREYFRGERMNMDALRNAWQKVYPNDLQLVPQVHTYSDEGDTPFIVMDLVKGTPVDELLRKGVVFTEKQALSIMVQFVKLLHVLHKETNQSYADLKFENLFIIDDTEFMGLKVIDWNILDKYSVESEQKDLFFASVYLYQILTNITPAVRGIKVHGRIDQVDKFGLLSQPMQLALRRLLNNNLAIRPSTALEWLEEVQLMYDGWTEPVETLVAELESSVSEVVDNRSDYSQEDLYEIYQMLNAQIEILQKRALEPENVVKLRVWQQQLNQIHVETRVDRGIANLRACSFDSATNAFLEGASLDLVEKETYLRWYWFATGAARVGRDYFFENRDDLIPILEYHLAGEYRRVMSLFEQLSLEKLPDAWQALHDEAEIYGLAQDASLEADRDEFSKSKELYAKALSLSDALPKEPATDWHEYLGDIHALYDEVVQLEQTVGAYHQRMKVAKEKYAEGYHQQAIDQLKAAISLVPDNFEEVTLLWKEWAEKELHSGSEAGHLCCDEAVTTPYVKDSFDQLYRFSYTIRQLQQKVQVGAVADAVKIFEKMVSTFNGRLNVFEYAEVQQLFTQIVNGAIEQSDAETGLALLAVAENSGDQWAKETGSALISSLVEKQMRLAISLAGENSLQSSRKALQIIKGLQKIVEPFGNELLSAYETDIRHISQLYQGQKVALEKDQEKINTLKETIADYENRLASIKNFEENSIQFVSKMLPGVQNNYHQQLVPQIDKEYTNLVCDALIASYELKSLLDEIDPAFAEEKIASFHTLIGRNPEDYDKVFEVLASQAEGATLGRFQELVMQRAKAAFDAGYPKETLQNLGYLGAELESNREALKLQQDAEKAVQLLNCSTEEEFKQFNPKDYPLPATYWKTPLRVREYYQKKTQQLQNQLLSTRPNQHGFSTLLKQLIESQKKYFDILLAAGEVSQPNRASSLADVVNQVSKMAGRRQTGSHDALLKSIASLPDQPYTSVMIDDLLKKDKAQSEDSQGTAQSTSLFTWISLGAAIVALILLGVSLLTSKKNTEQLNANIAATETAYLVALEECQNAAVCPECVCEPCTADESAALTEEPVVIPSSIYDVSGQQFSSQPWVYPDMDIRYIIDDPLILQPDIAGMQSMSGVGYEDDLTVLAGSGESVGKVSANWMLDQQITESGYYEIFVSDPTQYSGTSAFTPVYKVFQDSEVTPVVGDGTVAFSSSADQTVNEWRSIGVYPLKEALTVRVVFDMEDVLLAENEMLPFDAVLFAKVASPDTSLPLINDLVNVKQDKVLYWVDDPATQRDGDGWFTGPENEDEKFQSTWNGESYLSINKDNSPVTVTWQFSEPLRGIGNVYQPGIRISNYIEIPVSFELFVNDKSTGEILTVRPEDGNGGTFQYFNAITLDQDVEYTIKIVMTANWPEDAPETVTEYLIGIDVAILNALPRISN